MDERPEVTRAIVLLETGEREARDGIVQIDLKQHEPLVVAEADVVTRMKFLDQLAFEQQRLGFAADDVHIEVMDGLDERAEFDVPTQAARRLEILADATAKI